ncbi:MULTISPECIES: tail fiber assembly protein [Citrobacter freundii complex]|uniref:Tail fiber assembly protein n=1 Tax=Citrobacter portucalensis TaxID=1639133 RepID=A0ABZ0H6L8_9ENTR|nr:tail fiber assembly protein [Citrobacter portucalensis]MCE9896281.1 tail fiber assembly protein [Citrobacter portucalensis]MDE9575192.1 tail fiber assembly protein [Citrobacter portucalensis]MDE9648484.1 tail fiber assembly protein [Citrobacter portucalensis]MEB2741366.1 tail fiber assembly protein [Citrobacter portucalensis]WOH45337.1 tail fiber assembly protein [Citrobacter portucalensis]
MTEKNEQIANLPPVRIDGYIWDTKNIRLLAYLLKPEYQESGMWPDDGVDVSDEVSTEYAGQPPNGKKLGVGTDGMPAWVDIPPPTPEELAAFAVQKKSALLAEASTVIAPLRDASDGGYIDDTDKPKLVAWLKYRYDLTKVDPVKPVWPVKPAA